MFIFRRNFGIFSGIRNALKSGSKSEEIVGEDFYGNKYYQVYDGEGFPIKRSVVYKDGVHNARMDPIWTGWLKGTEKLPPKKEDIEESFGGYLKRKAIGEEYDKKDEEIMKKFREAMKKTAKPKTQEFEPAAWKPDLKNNKKY